MSEAIVRSATSSFQLIEGSQLQNLDDLTVNGKPILIVKGGSSQKLVAKVFREYSKQRDKAGKPFKLSRALRSIMHTDPYRHCVKISGPQMEEYLDSFFVYAELVHSTPPQSFNAAPVTGGSQQYLRLLDKLPAHVNALLAQGRFVQPEMLTGMVFVD
jgi:hypothetical protein